MASHVHWSWGLGAGLDNRSLFVLTGVFRGLSGIEGIVNDKVRERCRSAGVVGAGTCRTGGMAGIGMMERCRCACDVGRDTWDVDTRLDAPKVDGWVETR